MLQIGEARIAYNRSFRLYLTSPSSSPHFLPEIYALVCVVDCTVTPIGLEEQLLARVVAHEAPDMEIKHADLVMHTANDKKQLHTMEEGLLQLLYQVIKRKTLS